MNQKLMKVLLGVVIAVGILFGAISYYVSTQIKTEDIRKLIVKTINESLPGAEASLKEVDYGVGTSVKLYLNEFSLRATTNQKKLVGVGEVEVKIPLWAIFTGGGTVSVKVQEPELNVRTKTYGGTNWDGVFPETKDIEEKVEKKEEGDGSITIPSFLKESKVDVVIEKTKLNLKQGINPESQILVKKVRLINLNLKGTSSFDVQTAINYNLSKTDKFTGEVHVVGEVNIAKFLEQQQLEVNVKTSMKNLEMTGLPLEIPGIKVTQGIIIDKAGVIKVDNNVSLGQLMTSKSKVTVNNSLITVSDLDTKVILKEAIDILDDEIKESLAPVSFDGSVIDLNGSISLNTEKSAFKPNLNFAMKKPVVVKHSGLTINNTFKGSFKGKKIDITAQNELFNGTISSNIKTSLDPLNLPAALDKYKKIDVNVMMSNLKLQKDVIQNIIYGGKKEVIVDEQTGEPIPPKGTELSLPPVNINVKSSNVFVADQQLKINMGINIAGKNIKSKVFKVGYGQGTTDITFKTYLKNTASIYNNFTLKLKNMNFIGFHPFLPKGLDNVSGLFGGDVKGKLDLLPLELKYDIDVDFKARDGQLKKMDFASYIKPMVDKVDALKGKADGLIMSDSFEDLTFIGKATERVIKIKKFKFSTGKKGGAITADGTVSMVDGPSKVKASFYDYAGDVGKQLKQLTGSVELPLMLKGQGFGLIPDAGYTPGEILKRAGTHKVKQAKKQAKKAVNKAVNKQKKKLKKDLEKKAKKLLKGFKF
jgi:hypothetical protein